MSALVCRLLRVGKMIEQLSFEGCVEGDYAEGDAPVDAPQRSTMMWPEIWDSEQCVPVELHLPQQAGFRPFISESLTPLGGKRISSKPLARQSRIPTSA